VVLPAPIFPAIAICFGFVFAFAIKIQKVNIPDSRTFKVILLFGIWVCELIFFKNK
jgi:hypothetical protein